MFTKSKISQSMLDAVNSVINEEDKKLLLEPGKSTKLPMPTGTKVLGHRYGNSAKAHKDQTSHEIDKVKEPSNKELAKESFEDEHGISDKSFKSKLVNKAKKSMKEGKGNGPQETFTDNNMGESHVETTHKSPAKGTDLADKSYLKDMGKKPSVKSDIKNLGRFLTGKKETNEAVESLDEVKKMDDATRNLLIHAHAYATGKIHKKMMNGGYKDKGEMAIHHAQELNHALSTLGRGEKLKEDVTEEGLDEMINEVLSKDASAGDWIHDFVHSDNPKFAGKSKAERKKMALGAYYGKQNEESEVTTDMIKGRESGGKSNSFKGYKVTLKDGEKIEVPPSEETGEDTPARNSIKAKLSTTISQMHKEEAILDEMINEVMAKDASAGDWIKDFTDSENPKFAGKSKKKRKEMALAAYYSKKNEEVELDEAKKMDDATRNLLIHAHAYATGKITKKMMNGGYKDKGEMAIHHAQELNHALSTLSRGEKLKEETNEEVELDEAVSRKDFQMVADLIKTHDDHGKRKELAQHHAEIFHRQNPRFDRSKFMKAANVTEETVSEGRMKDIATGKEEDERLGTWKKETPWKDSKETITDKSGAKHTPMSRAKDLARSAFKKLQKETMMGKISN